MKEVITLERPIKETLAAPVIKHGFEMRFVGKPGTERTNLNQLSVAVGGDRTTWLTTTRSGLPMLPSKHWHILWDELALLGEPEKPIWHELEPDPESPCYASYGLPDEAAFAVPPLRRAAQWLWARFTRRGGTDEVVVLGNDPCAQPGLVLGYRNEAS